MTNDIITFIGAGVLILLILVLIFGLSGIITMLAWNLVMPYLFHLPPIMLLQAVALNLLLYLIKPVVSITQKGKK